MFREREHMLLLLLRKQAIRSPRRMRLYENVAVHTRSKQKCAMILSKPTTHKVRILLRCSEHLLSGSLHVVT